ncbi:YtxH domain-containing protein [Arundinibacter roseus]|uniref:YtxH domain-containing protein n=1 Tax=Arundinibacter roseus TaxID=2070510 RepID=A0A4R4KDD9_9BACT|nr:YtxH domain-containing protein [Arundinibacter roseus]TDB65848.1 YtxH domain-containing protein [Arundinibacter roseus]
MSVNAKHLATFILGAAAGASLYKFLQTDEGEKMLEDLKTKAGSLRDEAEGAVDRAPEYFEQLKNKGADALKENFPDAEQMLRDLMDKFSGKTPPTPSDSEPTP